MCTRREEKRRVEKSREEKRREEKRREEKRGSREEKRSRGERKTAAQPTCGTTPTAARSHRGSSAVMSSPSREMLPLLGSYSLGGEEGCERERARNRSRV